jgi:hypothetical protein
LPQRGFGRESFGERGGLQRRHFEQSTQARQGVLPGAGGGGEVAGEQAKQNKQPFHCMIQRRRNASAI